MAQTATKTQESFIRRLFRGLAKKTRWRKDNTPENYYTRYPHLFWADLPRLTRGKVQYMLVEYSWRSTVGLERDEKTPAPGKTGKLAWNELAEVFRCSVQEVKDDAREAAARGVIAIEESPGGVLIEVLFRKWGDLPDYKPGRPQLVKDPKPEEPEKPLCAPFRVDRGQKHPFLPLPDDVRAYRFELDGDGFDAVDVAPILRKGKLTYKLRLPESKELPAKNRKSTGVYYSNSPDEHEAKIELPQLIVSACARYDITDAGSILQMIAECRSHAPDVSEQDIASQIEIRGRSALSTRSVKNVSAVILKRVPLYFASESFKSGPKKKPVNTEKSAPLCSRCHDTGVIGYKGDTISFSDVRRELAEGRELCDCKDAEIWREMMRA